MHNLNHQTVDEYGWLNGVVEEAIRDLLKKCANADRGTTNLTRCETCIQTDNARPYCSVLLSVL